MFSRELATAQIETDAVVMASLMGQIRKGNVTAAIWYMKNRMGWRDHPPEKPQTGQGPAVKLQINFVKPGAGVVSTMAGAYGEMKQVEESKQLIESGLTKTGKHWTGRRH